MNIPDTMSLKSSMQLLANLDTQPKPTKDILKALNTVVNSPDISHMSRKGLYMALRYLAENLDTLSVTHKGVDNEEAETQV